MDPPVYALADAVVLVEPGRLLCRGDSPFQSALGNRRIQPPHTIFRQGEQGVRSRVLRIENDRLLEQPARFGIGLRIAEGQRVAAQHALVGCKAGRRLASGMFGAGGLQASDERRCDSADDLVLNREDCLFLTVETFGPYMLARRRVDELSGDADLFARLAYAAFDHELDPEFLCLTS